MAKTILAYSSFNKVTKTITFPAATFDVKNLYAVINKTANVLLYAPTVSGCGYLSFTSTTLVLEIDTNIGTIANTDELMILYEVSSTSGGDASSANQVLQTTALNSILSELQNSIAFSETVWYDVAIPTNFYVRGVNIDQTTGTQTISWKNPLGTVVSITGLTLVQAIASADFEFNTVERIAIAAGTGYSIGDYIRESNIFNMNTATLVATIWNNLTLNTVLGTVPTLANVPVNDSYATKANQAAQVTLATAANTKIDTGNTSLASVDTKIPALGQALAAASTPVVLTAAQMVALTPPAAIVGFNLEATQLLVKAKTDNLDVLLSTRTKPSDQQHAIIDSSALPSGAATSAKQDTGNTSLASVDTKLSSQATAANQATEIASLANIDSKTPALGQALATASTPVVLTAAQITALTPPAAITGFNSEATQLLVKAKTDNLDVLLSTRLKPADTLAAVTQITNPVATTIADGVDVAQGAKADTVATSDTGTFSLISLFKRLLQGITTLNVFPVATAANDTVNNPTISYLGAVGMLYNGTNWDRARGLGVATTTGDSGAKTATGNGATQTNVGNKGVFISIVLGTVTGTAPTAVFKVQSSANGGTTWHDIPNAATASLLATGNYGISIYPALTVVAGSVTSNTQAQASGVLARSWRVVWTIGGTTPSFAITSITYNYLNN